MTGMSCRVVSLKGPTNAARWGGVGPHTYNVDVTPAEGGAFLNLGLEYPKGCLPIVHKISLEHVIRQLAVAGLDMREDKAPGAAGTNRQPRSFDNMDSLFLRNIADHLLVMEQVKALDPVVQSAIECITRSLRDGGKVMFCGNGGSAADSQHLAAEFTGRFIEDRKPLAALALSTDTSALTCIGNDYSFDDVFARQVIGLGRPGDCLVGISTSGNSRNVLRAIEAAKAAGIACIGLLGRDGGELRQLCDLSIVVPSRTTARIQEAHILIGHTICGGVEIALGLAG